MNMILEPGDRVSASVAVSGSAVTVSISNLTRNTTFTKQSQMADPNVASTEWIAEAPSNVRPQLPNPSAGPLRHGELYERDGVGRRCERLNRERSRLDHGPDA